MKLLLERNVYGARAHAHGEEARLTSLIDSMDTIGLAEMDSVALMDRVDTKFVLGKECLIQLLPRLCYDYRVLEVEGVRISPYATLYFDTPQLDCYREHHNRKLNRRKYRMRKYLTTGISFFEVKSKNNRGLTNKCRIPIEDIQETFTSDSIDFLRSVTGSVPQLLPQLWSHFSRVTLVNRHIAERVTLDWGLVFCSLEGAKELKNIVIAEVKQTTDDRSSPVRLQLRSLNVRPMRVSKYCLGSILLSPKLKQNRFKWKLLAIQKMLSNNPA